MIRQLTIFIFIVIGTYSFVMGSSAIIIEDGEKKQFNLSDYLSVWEVPTTSAKNLTDAILAKSKNKFVAAQKQTLNYGFTNQYIWVHFSVKNITEKKRRLVLGITNPMFNDIEFFQVINKEVIKSIHAGDHYKFSAREINHTDYLFDIELKPNELNEIYLKLHSDGEALIAPFQLMDYKSFFEKESLNKLLAGAFYGLIFFVICFNFFLLFVIKQRLYLYYNFFIIFLFVFIFGVDGLLFKYVFPEHPFIANQVIVFSGAFTNLFLLILAQYFRKSRIDGSKADSSILMLVSFAGVVGVIAFMGEPIFYYSYVAAFVISVAFPVYILIKAIRTFNINENHAKYFIIAFTTFIAGIVLFVLKNIGVLQVDPAGIFFLKIGACLLVIILALAITERFKNLRDVAKEELQSIVELRTKEIIRQNKDILDRAEIIEKNNIELEKLSIVARETENGVTVSDIDGNIIFQNNGYKELYGFSFDTKVEGKLAKLQELTENIDVEFEMSKCISLNESISYENTINKDDKRTKWVQTTITPISDNDGKIKYLAALDIDITYSKRTEEKLLERNLNITHSIRTAQNIQNAILPLAHIIKRLLPKSFIFFLPKDIVSGDFYWIDRKKGKVLLAAVDCTGHGVPGALMSIVAFIELSKATKEKKLTKPSEILASLNNGINESLRITNEDDSVKEGLDIALCSIDFKSKELIFAGAHNPLMLIRNKKLHEYKSESYPIGIFYGERPKTFRDHVIKLEEGDSIYIFSDGFADQFGGPKNRKYLIKRFKDTLIKISDEPMAEQHRKIQREFFDWKGSNQQIDDVLVIGMKI